MKLLLQMYRDPLDQHPDAEHQSQYHFEQSKDIARLLARGNVESIREQSPRKDLEYGISLVETILKGMRKREWIEYKKDNDKLLHRTRNIDFDPSPSNAPLGGPQGSGERRWSLLRQHR